MINLIFDNLSRHAALWIKEWNQTSIDRGLLSYPLLERLMRSADESPFCFVFLIWLIAVNLSIWLGWSGVEIFRFCSPIPSKWNASELLTYFGILWTLQGTIVALVYPIVIAFITLLLQRNATAKLSLRLYIQDAAVISAGSSAIALLMWMGLQYLAISYLPILWLSCAMIGNSVWFILNLLFTSWFLYRTVRFLNDDERYQILARFAVHVAFPREVRLHLLGNIFSRAQAYNLIPGKSYTDSGPGPKVLLYPMAEGDPCITIYLEQKQTVIDIRLRLLAWGVKLWLSQSEKTITSQDLVGQNPPEPLLVIPIAPGDIVQGKFVLCRVRDSKRPGFLASFLIRHSLVFASPLRVGTLYSSSKILDEMAVETLCLAEQKQLEAASETMVGLTELHGALVRSGSFINDKAKHDNAALLPDPYGFASLPIHLGWLDAYRKIAEFIVRENLLGSSLYKRYCYLTSRFADDLKDDHTDIKTHGLFISTYLMYQLGIWWVNKVEERGLIAHDSLHAVVLPLPLGGTYDRALKTFIEGWEATEETWSLNEQPSNAEEAWNNLSRHAIFAAAQMGKTVEMLLEAVVRGDRVAAQWLTNSFLNWWERHQYHLDQNYSSEHQNSLLTFSSFRMKWSEVRNSLDGVPEGQQEIILPNEVVSTLLRRYWLDLRFVIILILLDWTPCNDVQDSFTVELAKILLQDKDLADELADSSRVLFRLVRLQLMNREYTEMFDKIVEYAQKLRSPDMIAGRICTSTWSGPAGVESLCLAQNQLLGVITNNVIMCNHELKNAISTWANDKDLRQLQRCKRLAEKLSESVNSNNIKDKYHVLEVMRVGQQRNLDEVISWIDTAWHELENLAVNTHDDTLKNAKISQKRLDEIGKVVTTFLFGSDNKIFPFSFVSAFKDISGDIKPRSLPFTGIQKQPYTDPPFEDGSSYVQNLYNKNIALAISDGIISDYIEATDTKPLRTDTEQTFFEDLGIRAELLRKKGLTPVLVTPENNSLRWLSLWRYQNGSAEDSIGVSFRPPKKNDDIGIIGYFNDVAIYRALLFKNDCYVFPKERFEIISYKEASTDSGVEVTAKPENDNKIRISFEWKFN